jgi:hypothetical protein
MHRIAALLLGFLLAACGAEAPAPPGKAQPQAGSPVHRNQPPEIVSLRLVPAEPSRQETIRLFLETRDPDRDSLKTQVTWIRNNAVYRSGPETTLSGEGLSPGDLLFARVRVTDGQFEDVEETERVRIRNLPPRVTSVRIEPETITATESVIAVTDAVDPEQDQIDYRFSWLRNGSEIPDQTGPTLEPGFVHRGEEISVTVVPVDERGNEGDEVRSARIRVQNAPPMITSEPSFTLAGPSRYEYQVQAEDPDGDHPLRFALTEGPHGMRVDIVTGELSWDIPDHATGSHEVEVSVRDPYGGESRQSYSLNVRLELPPASSR